MLLVEARHPLFMGAVAAMVATTGPLLELPLPQGTRGNIESLTYLFRPPGRSWGEGFRSLQGMKGVAIMSKQAKATGFHPVRHDRLVQEYRHDAYKSAGKLSEPTACPRCGAVFQAGRWQWIPRPEAAEEAMCPACHRIADEFPAGFVHLSGEFLDGHGQELLQLVEHTATQETERHPLERIMARTAEDGGLLITTTGIHLARRLGEALHHAYHGELEFHYNEDEILLRVHWRR